MGVYGLWRLLDSTGKPVPLETLEGKVLAIDVSIWIHQVLQGYQDRHGQPKPNAHLLGLFNRICKLLYYKIKPVFVFDGGVPMLKKNTIAARRKQKSIATSKAQKMKADLINNLIKHAAVKTALNPDSVDNRNPPVEVPADLRSKSSIHDMFKLPDMPAIVKTSYVSSDDSGSDSDFSTPSPRKQSRWIGNIHNVDVSSAEFKALPADVRYDILTDLKETRKQNSWGRLHEMPDETHDFSCFQMKRLLKRRLVQECLESAEKEMGGKTLTMKELEILLTEQGINTKGRDDAFRIAGDSTTRLIYISDKNALENNVADKDSSTNIGEEVEPVPGPSKSVPIFEDMNEYELNDEWDSDVELTFSNSASAVETTEFEVDSDVESEKTMNESRTLSKKFFGKNVANPALSYMLEHSGLTQKQIVALLKQNNGESNKITENPTKQFETDDHRPPDSKITEDIPKPSFTEDGGVSQKTEGTSAFDLLLSSVQKNGNVAEPSKDQVSPVEDGVVPESECPKTDPTFDQRTPPMNRVSEPTAVSTTDTDSDDFIEIKDVPIPNAVVTKKDSSKRAIEIMIKSDEKIEDDLFADVFEATTNDLNSTTTSQEIIEVDDSFSNSSQSLTREIIGIEEKSLNDVPAARLDNCEKVDVKLTQRKDESAEAPVTVPNKPAEYDQRNHVESINEGIQAGASQFSEEETTFSVNNPDYPETETTQVNETKRLSPLPVNEDELLTLKSQLENQQGELAANIGKLERQATDISDQIRIEAQELLKLFGIPYVVAPMEAEAQCAYLEQIRLTDGTITDDSDVWLFGGQCVYKNFFNHNKRVLQFRSCDIQHHFKLTRNQMIQLALLVGSDYTTGVAGVGPVTALEILAAFPTEGDNLLHGLINFCSWIKGGRLPGPGRTGLRNKLRNVQIEKGFPSQAVVQAYLFPTIDESRDTFTWGKPNDVLLADYVKLKFGWTKLKYDEVMKPVWKRFEEHKSQKAIDSYFKSQSIPKSIESNLSKRVQNAVRKLNNECVDEPEDVTTAEPRKKRNRTKVTKEAQGEQKNTTIGENDVQPENKSENQNAVGEKTPTAEYIPQREKDKAEALKKKLHAIEVLRKSNKGLNKTRKVKRHVRKVKKEAELSESDSSST